MTRTYVWSLFTRLFHLFLIIGIAAAYMISDFENLLSYHAAAGYFVGVLLLFRIVWGYMDVKFSKFEDFNFNLRDLADYLFAIFGRKKEYVGHNPASSWAIVAMIALGLASVGSGVVVYGTQEGMGVLSFLNKSLFGEMDFFEELHEFFSNAFIFVIFIHVLGVFIDRFFHKSQAVDSMIDGYKYSTEDELRLTFLQRLFGVVWITTSILLLFYILANPSNMFIADANERVDYKAEHKMFESECISCHTLYPPYLLPRESWVLVMDNLQNHFGDDASLDEADKESIKEYLVNNAAESSTKESAQKILKSIKDRETIAITKTPYWERKHENIDKSVFENKKIAAKSNCKACHKDIEQGLLNDKDIKIPKLT